MGMKWLLGIFILALMVRFFYFPGNIYFGFDQARDAFSIREILDGHLKLVGPSTSTEGLNHGPLFYYLYAPFYLIGQGDPMWMAGFVRVANAMAAVLVFMIASILFNKKTGLIAALLFAVSFEQTQWALYTGNPSLGVLSVLLMYLGLAMLIFRRQPYGLMLALVGYGLSINFEFANLHLLIPLVLSLAFYRKKIWPIGKKYLLAAVIGFGLSISTFIITDLKFGFQTTKNILLLVRLRQGGEMPNYLGNLYYISLRFVHDNLMSFEGLSSVVVFGLLAIFLYFMLRFKTDRRQLIFLLIWFSGGWVAYLRNFSNLPLYYYSAAASVSLLIFAAMLIEKISLKNRLMASLLVLIILWSNLSLIGQFNWQGTIPELYVQSGMLLKDEKQVIDYTYIMAEGQPFAVNSLSMPFNINTTWSYLYEWYGQKRYGYLPIWGADVAVGFPGNLKVISARSTLPEKRFSIIEPTRGVAGWFIEDFFTNENYFTKVVEQKKFGKLMVQLREPI